MNKQLRCQIYNGLGNQLWDQLEDQLGTQLWDQLDDQLWEQVRGQQARSKNPFPLWTLLRNQLGVTLRGSL